VVFHKLRRDPDESESFDFCTDRRRSSPKLTIAGPDHASLADLRKPRIRSYWPKHPRLFLHTDKDLIRKCCATGAVPMLIARRIHYSAITNLLAPAGIIAHQSYYQYYPDGHDDLIEQVRDKRSLGFTDVRSWQNPHARTASFFKSSLPAVGPEMAARFRRFRRPLLEYAENRITRAALYRAIRSPAAHRGARGELPDDV
jgi:hypothetical protein